MDDALPEGAVDVTAAVSETVMLLHKLFAGKDIAVVALALGTVVGEVADDEEWLKHMLLNITSVAFQVYGNNQEAGGTIH